MSKPLDLINQKFNRWTVISRAPNNKRGETMWYCECDCGTKKIVNGYSLRAGTSKSCGCLQKEVVIQNSFEDLVGQKFGRLTVLKYYGQDKTGKRMWTCKCDCCAQTIVQVRAADLKSGKTTSCGCLSSVGEEKIAYLLTQAGIPFEKEKTFSTCRFETGGLARFDFYVNNKYLIEYDGIQHFKPTFNKLDKNAFLITQTHDNYKEQWCKDNNIPLIRISYLQLKELTLEDLLL